jgi:Tol biopolymer transport system component
MIMNPRRVITAVLALALFAAASGYAQQTAEELYQAGLYQEEVQGNLESAIEIYERILDEFPANRPVAARALMHIGLCHEKLGSRDAQRAYERLVRDYADQTEVADRARARLADLQGLARAAAPAEAAGASGIVVRELWAGRTGLEADASGGPSPDGRYLAYVNWKMTGADIAVRDLVTGESRQLTDHPGYFEGFPLGARFSPDGETIAYSWFPADSAVETRLLSVDGSGSRTLCRDPDYMFWPGPWSKDGKHLVVTKMGPSDNPTKEIGWASTEDCTFRAFTAFAVGKPLGSGASLSPDDRYLLSDYPVDRDSDRRDIRLTATDGSFEATLIEHPANDRLLGWLPDTPYVLFVSDRGGTWDLYAIEVVNGEAKGSPRVLMRSVGQAAPMGFTRDGSLFYWVYTFRSTANVAPFAAKTGQPDVDAAQPLLGSNVAPDWSADGKYLAYWRKEDLPSGPGDWSQVLVIRDVETGVEREPAPQLEVGMLRWSRDGRSIVATGIEQARSDSHEARVYRIDVGSGEVTTLLEFPPDPEGWWSIGAIETADGDGVIYVREGRLVLNDLLSNQETMLMRHPGLVSRLLSLSPDGQRLLFAVADSTDEYVQRGTPPRLDVSGKFMIADLSSGELRELLSLERPGDVRNLEWGPDGAYVYFTEDVENMTILRRVSVEGGEVEQVWVSQQPLHDLTINPQGQRVAYTIFENVVEIYVMENLVAALSDAE